MIPNQIWQLDIFILQKYSKHNKGFKNIICAIDVFTRKVYAVPIKTKNIDDCTTGLNEIITQAGVSPVTIMSDNDSSFKGNVFQKLLSKYNIIHYMNIVGDHHALGIIDRITRTLKSIITKLFLRNKNNNWVDYLDKIINIYNNSLHLII